MIDKKKLEQIYSLAETLRGEKNKYPNHLLNNYVIYIFTDAVGLLDKRTKQMIKIHY